MVYLLFALYFVLHTAKQERQVHCYSDAFKPLQSGGRASDGEEARVDIVNEGQPAMRRGAGRVVCGNCDISIVRRA